MMGFGSFSGGSNIMSSFFSKSSNAITSALGCPSLSSLGLSFNNLKRIFGNNDDIVNVELKDMSLQTSTYNKIIPEVFGQVRIAGNMIWCSEIKTTNIQHQQKITKMGTQSAYTENLVRASFAIAICKGKVDSVKNIFADGEPLNMAGYNIKIYYGDNEQVQDSTLQTYLGTDIPAFRGLCYVVFTEFPMEQFNNRIPNFTFDIVKQQGIAGENDISNLVSAITMIPGSGEFVYDTKTQRKLNGGYIMGTFYETSKATILNNHTATENTNAVDSLDDLIKTFPNLEWVSLVVSWFCDNVNSDYANVYPACEWDSMITKPEDWQVAGIKRTKARVVGRDAKGNMRYGGTPSDNSVVRYVKEMKKRGLKVCLYPMLMVDTDQKPWRGHMTGSANKINTFFTKTNGYNQFIKHYANLLKDDIDAIIIGSEMKGLTSVKASNGTYPAVDCFCNLAQEIKGIVGNRVITTYAGDWSEYHHNDYGEYNMDKLWACEYLDRIGIDAYFPLSNSTSSIYDTAELIRGWRSGEGYDFYYTNGERTEKGDFSPEWAWKNVEYFWSHYHYTSDGTTTEWVPKMKKIWFTEYGFPSVDCCSNEPNVFFSTGSLDSGFPRYSKGEVDFLAQRTAILATELAWKNSECVEQKFLYTWDARPYPYFPNLSDVWSDAGAWKYGHFMNGKVGEAKLTNIIALLCYKLGLTSDEIDTTLLKDNIMQGYVIDDKHTLLSHLKILAEAYKFDAYLDDGKICFKSLDFADTHKISEDELVVDTATNEVVFHKESISLSTLPSSVELLFLDIDNDYQTSTAIAKDSSRNTTSYSVSIGVPMNLSQAQEIAWRVLSNISTQNTEYTFQLPISRININPLDIISIEVGCEKHLIRVKSVDIIDATKIQIRGVSTIANDSILTDLEYSNIITKQPVSTSLIPETQFELFELHNIKNDVLNDSFTIHCAVWSDDDNWEGASLYYSVDNEQNYNFLTYVKNESCIGRLLDIQQSDTPCLVDDITKIELSILNEDGKLQTITDEKFSQLENLILVGDEIIAFRDVEQIDETRFVLSHLLRGRFNTETAMVNHTLGERVILLDNDIQTIDLPITQKGKTIYIKAISLNDTMLNSEEHHIQAQALSAKDFDAKNYSMTTMLNGDIRLSFSSCKCYKVLSGGVALSNMLYLHIYDKLTDNLIRTATLKDTSSMIYTTSMMKNDFGKIITQDDIYFKVENIIKVYGV